MDDPYDLERFVTAQNAGNTYGRAVEELRRGRKTSHWMWFIFPQVAGLGQSQVSRTYAISSIEEARAYLQHPMLGKRIHECAAIVADSSARSATELFGSTDAQKLRSSMTLFLRADTNADTSAAESIAASVFQEVLNRYFGGTPDPATDQRL